MPGESHTYANLIRPDENASFTGAPASVAGLIKKKEKIISTKILVSLVNYCAS